MQLSFTLKVGAMTLVRLLARAMVKLVSVENVTATATVQYMQYITVNAVDVSKNKRKIAIILIFFNKKQCQMLHMFYYS